MSPFDQGPYPNHCREKEGCEAVWHVAWCPEDDRYEDEVRRSVPGIAYAMVLTSIAAAVLYFLSI